MVRILLLVSLLLTGHWLAGAEPVFWKQDAVQAPASGYPYLRWTPADGKRPEKGWPLVLWLHGFSLRGNDLAKLKDYGPPAVIDRLEANGVIVAPQLPGSKLVWDSKTLDETLLAILATDKFDRGRIYLAGASLGAGTAYDWMARAPETFAGLVMLAGAGNPAKAESVAKRPVWIFHGPADKQVTLKQARATLDYVPHMYYQELWYETPRWAILVPPALIALLMLAHRLLQRPLPEPASLPTNTYFLLMFVAGTGSSGLNHSTQWAYANCFMPIAVFASLFIALVVRDLRALGAGSALVSGALAVQLVAFAYDPRAQMPGAADYAALADFEAALAEVPGPVFAPAHPFVAWQRDARVHVHQMGIQDVAFMGGVKDLERRLAAHEWAAVVLDEDNRIPGLERHYRLSRKFDWPVKDALRAKTGFLVRPQSLWVPKR